MTYDPTERARRLVDNCDGMTRTTILGIVAAELTRAYEAGQQSIMPGAWSIIEEHLAEAIARAERAERQRDEARSDLRAALDVDDEGYDVLLTTLRTRIRALAERALEMGRGTAYDEPRDATIARELLAILDGGSDE